MYKKYKDTKNDRKNRKDTWQSAINIKIDNKSKCFCT